MEQNTITYMELKHPANTEETLKLAVAAAAHPGMPLTSSAMVMADGFTAWMTRFASAR